MTKLVLKRRKKQTSPLWVGLAILLFQAGFSGCNWISVSYSALNYPTTTKGEAANVVVFGTKAYATLADDGLEITDLTGSMQRTRILPPAGSESIDDLAVADGLLFVLDARTPGHLSLFSLSDSVVLVSGPIEVPVEPFSGVSAGGGSVIVSGGTSSLTLYHYDRQGRLSPEVARIDLGRGQPEVLVAPDGKHAYISTHYIGPYFGLTVVEIGGDSAELTKRGDVELDTYGFTSGGAKPANFPVEPALHGDVLYVAHAAGLGVISLSDPARPKLLTVVDVGVEPVNVDVSGDVAAVVGSSPRPALVLLDVTDPAAPVVKETVPLPEGSYATSVSIGEHHIAVAAHKSGVLLYPHHTWSLRPERSYQ